MKKFEKLISTAVQSEVSDIHIAGGHATVLRHHGRIRKDEEEIWTHEEVDRLVGGLLDDNQLRMLRSR